MSQSKENLHLRNANGHLITFYRLIATTISKKAY